jgi:hypothetical protein
MSETHTTTASVANGFDRPGAIASADARASGPAGEPASLNASRWAFAAVALGAFVVGAGLRALVNYRSWVPPGMDAGYYPFQTRALMEEGSLRLAELPLMFWLNAGVSRVMMWAGLDIDRATLEASRLIDSLAQPSAAIAIVGVGWLMARGRRAGELVVLGVGGAALLGVASFPIIRMTGDFEKNALGLVWMALGAWAVLWAMQSGRIFAWGAVAACAGLSALTHVGAAGATLVLLGGSLGAYVLISGRVSFARAGLLLGGGALVAALAIGAVYIASRAKGQRLLTAPLRLMGMIDDRAQANASSSSRTAAPAPSAPGDATGDGRPNLSQRGGGPGGLSGPGGPGGGPRFGADPTSLGVFVVVYGLAGAGLWTAWRRRREGDPAEAALVVGASAAGMLLCFPLMNGEYLMRLALMAPLPASIVLVYVVTRQRATPLDATSAEASLGHAPGVGRGVWAGVVIGAAALLSGAAGVVGGVGARVVDDEAVAEFRTMAKEIDRPLETLVVARHGVEWWAGYFLRAHVKMERVPDDAFEKYARVLVLETLRGGGPGGPGGPGGQGRQGGPGRGPGGPGSAGGGGGGMGRVVIPRGSRVVFEGVYYRLWEVPRDASGRSSVRSSEWRRRLDSV